MGTTIFIFVTIATFHFCSANISSDLPITSHPRFTSRPKLPEENLDVPDLIRFWKYPVEVHEVCTADGYYLTLHRIPRGRERKEDQKLNGTRPVMLLHHGAVGSSSDFILNLPDQSLGFMLADAGYDVWMANARGNSYSKRHKIYSVNSTQFWEFSFEEMARYDFPAILDYVLDITGQKQLHYVGFSQGSMIAFAGLSENIELQKKIKGLFALGPAAKLGNIYSPIKYLAKLDYVLWAIAKIFHIREFLPSSKYVDYMAKHICPYYKSFCKNFVFILSGYDKKNINETRLPVYLTHNPAGTSMKNVLHYCQLVKSGIFQKYDYGWLKNLRQYGGFSPPNFHIETINVPVVLVAGSEDWLTPPDDVKWLSEQLPNVVKVIKVEGFNHIDYVWAGTAGEKINKKIIDIAAHKMV